MALVDCYVGLAEIAARAGIGDTHDDASIEAAITSACRAIDAYCGQPFYTKTSATARIYRPTCESYARVAPFHTTTGLVIKTDDNDDAAYETTWTSTQYELDVFNESIDGSPYDTIRAIGRTFATSGNRRRTLEVTAQWGWAAAPPNVVEAARILAVDLWKRKDTPFGIATATVEFGGMRIPRDMLRQVEPLLARYRAVASFGIA